MYIKAKAVSDTASSLPTEAILQFLSKKLGAFTHKAKVPHGKSGMRRKGKQNSQKDLAEQMTVQEAIAEKTARGHDGFGFALRRESGIGVIDLDDVRNPMTGELTSDAACLVRDAQTHCRISQSGKGVHIWFLHDDDPALINICHQQLLIDGTAGSQIFLDKQFVCWGAEPLPGTDKHVNSLSKKVNDVLLSFVENFDQLQSTTDATGPSQSQRDRFATMRNPNLRTPLSEVRRALEWIDPDAQREVWLKVCMGLHAEFQGSDKQSEAYQLFDKWSAGDLHSKTSSKYRGPDDTWRTWDSLQSNGGITLSTVFAIAKRRGGNPATMRGGFSNSDAVTTTLLQTNTEDSVALAASIKLRDQYVHTHGGKGWRRWDGTRWQEDLKGEISQDVRDLARQNNPKGNATPAKRSFTNGVLGHMKTDPIFSRIVADFDTDNYLLNTPEGTIDLQTGVMQPHNPDDLITLSTAVSPDSNGGDRFLRFMEEITDGDSGLASFLQVSLGACLSGAIEDHWLLFWFGKGRNGKNVLGDLIAYIMGDYSQAIPAHTLMAKRHAEHGTETMALKGIRLAVSSEVEEGGFWAESKINQVTGDTMLSGRYMRQDIQQFPRTHKHLIYGNHRPRLVNVTDGLKSRIKIVPFNVSFKGREDKDLPKTLKGEAGYVLSWLIEGHLTWLSNGKSLPKCESVDNESEDYFKTQSTVDTWIYERCKKVGDDGRSGSQWPKASALYEDYKYWKCRRGESPSSQTRFAEALRLHFEPTKSDGIRYIGVELLHPSEFPPTSESMKPREPDPWD